MNILLSNDDGIDSKGILSLYKSLRTFGNVYIAAPAVQHSGAGNSISLFSPITFEKYEIEEGIEGYKVYGTPADCVKVALNVIYKDIKFDYVFSGINLGSNVAMDMIYSGTVSAATEGSIRDIDSISISVPKNTEDEYIFSGACTFIEKYMEELKKIDLPKGTILNINVPSLKYDEIKSYLYVKQGGNSYEDNYIKRGKEYYFQYSNIKKGMNKCTDAGILFKDYVSITPIKVDRTDYDLLKDLEKNGYKVKEC